MKQRIISAFFLILISIPLLLAGGKTFAISISILGLFALKEIIDLKKSHEEIPVMMTFLFYLSLILLIFIRFSEKFSTYFICFILFLYLLPTLFYPKKKEYQTSDAFYFLGIILFLGYACHNMILIRDYSLWHFLYVILIPILTDSFAYLLGRRFGKRKLAPLISPNKTIEGSIWGSFLGTILGSVFYYFLIGPINILFLIGMTFLISVMGQLGDLFFSKIKRENGIKDFSDLIPGHGGILDRFDSILFSSMVFTLFISYL